MIDEGLAFTVWERLLAAKTLHDLPIAKVDGRLDLRGIRLPDPSVWREFQVAGRNIVEISPSAIFQKAHWLNLDFTGAILNSVRLHDSLIENCRFDKCQLRDLRLWSTSISRTSVVGCDLRGGALGATKGRLRNCYSEVDFSSADLRNTSYQATAFDHCTFRNTKLEKIDFQSSTFANCCFEGELRDVLFYRRGFRGESFPENQMTNVDFSNAKLRAVSFRGLTMDHVTLPQDGDHIIIPHFASTLDALISAFRKGEDTISKKIVAF